MEEVTKILTEIKPLVDKQIIKHIPKKGDPQVLFDACWEFLGAGGKRLRPALMATSCEALGGNPEDTVLAGTSLEIAHNFFLIHDDIEDFSELRRGQPCLHIKYGIPHAINVGDYLFAKSIEVCLSGQKMWGLVKTKKVLDLMDEMYVITAEGQAADIEARDKDLEGATVDWYKKMSLRKTGYYTGGTPCAIGAVIAGGENNQIKILKEFGFAIGVAFQIQDDILNVTMSLDEEKMAPSTKGGGYGKDFAGDIKEGKRTLLIVHLFAQASRSEKKDLKILVGKKDISLEEKIKVIELMRKYRSIDYASDYAKRMMERATRMLRDGIRPTRGRKKLEAIADFFVTRRF